MKLRLHPVTRQRLKRFRSMRRGWMALWVLLIAFFISLFSEWIANDKPLLIRCAGKTAFPVFKFYPEDTFLQNGRMTPPDYKALAKTELFAEGSGNWMRWPLIPYGPLEILKPEDIALKDEVTWIATPVFPIAAADFTPDGTVTHITGDAEMFNLSVGMNPVLPEEILSAFAPRFANLPAPALDFETPEGWLSLSPFQPRESPPENIRLTFRKQLAGVTPLHATVAAENPVFPAGFPTPGTPGWTFTQTREQIRFPFRPVAGHPLGIDAGGRDVAARMLYALRTSLAFGMLLVLCTMALGTLAGALQGYYAGRVDIFGQRLTEIWASLPFLYVLILLGSVYGQSFGMLLAIYAIFNWIGISYYMRGEFLRLRRWPFVEAARVAGIPAHRIIFRHILPNALTPLITFLPFSLVGAIGTMAALDYLGFGLPPPTPSWGELLAQAQEFPAAWWLIVFPTAALFCVMLSGVFIGESLRAAFDPKTHGRLQ